MLQSSVQTAATLPISNLHLAYYSLRYFRHWIVVPPKYKQAQIYLSPFPWLSLDAIAVSEPVAGNPNRCRH